jgi:hypothetical protein
VAAQEPDQAIDLNGGNWRILLKNYFGLDFAQLSFCSRAHSTQKVQTVRSADSMIALRM